MRDTDSVVDPMVPPRRRRLLIIVTLSVVLGVVALVAVVLTWRQMTSSTTASQDDPPVVVVSGYGGDGSDTEPMVAELTEQGRTVVVFPPVDDNTGDLNEQARLLGLFIEEQLESSGATSVDIIGYSAGGVTARLWVLDHGGSSVARRVLTIASPHHGSSLAGLADLAGLCEEACAQLVPDSDLLNRLNAEDETPEGPEWITIWSENDRTVSPPDTADLVGSLSFTVQSLCPGSRTSHAQLPSSPVVLAALTSVLSAETPAAPKSADIDCNA